MSRHLTRRVRSRRIAVAAVTVAATALTMVVSAAGPAQAADGYHTKQHRSSVPVGAVRTNRRPEALGSHGPKFQPSHASTRITGGVTANSADYPGIVGVLDYFQAYDSDQDQYYEDVQTCTGTVLSPTKILTAAICTTDFFEGTIQVVAGRSNLSLDGGTVYGVANIWTAQGYNIGPRYDNPALAPVDDLAVLTLKTPLDPAYVPYSLTPQGDQTPYAEGTQAEAVGYGLPADSDSAQVGVLYKATMPTQSDTTCAANASSFGDTYDPVRTACAGTLPSSPGTDGASACYGDAGAPLLVNGVEAGLSIYGECGTSYSYFARASYYNSVISADVNRTNMPVNLDFSGDGHSDLMFRDPTDTGSLVEITGAGLMFADSYGTNGGMTDYGWVTGGGWNAFSKIFRVTNWNGDHTESIFAEKSDGSLYQYKTDGAGNFVGKPALIGSGWSTFKDIMVTNNWLGDGRPNLMGRKSNGDLVLYTSNGQGGWTNSHGTLIGTGWGSFNTIITPGNWRGQGQALIGRTSTGDLKLYESNGHGGWLNTKGTVIGTGWNSLPTFISPGDWNGDNLIDLIGIAKNGDMKLYRTDGSGHWLNGKGDTMMGGWWPTGYFDGVSLFF